MNRRGRICLQAALALAQALVAQDPPRDPILRAMTEELARARQLRLAGLESPYYIEQAVDQSDNFAVAATLGGLVSSVRRSFLLPRAHVRVGSYSFDNGNSIYTGMPAGARYDQDDLPAESSAPLLRLQLWLATDRA